MMPMVMTHITLRLLMKMRTIPMTNMHTMSTTIRYVILIGVGVFMVYPLLWMISATFKDNNEIFSTLLDTKTAEKVWAVLQQFEQEEQLHLPDAGFLALAIHCTLTIQQLRQGGDKGSAPQRAAPGGQSCCPAGGGAEPRLRADPAA